MADPPPVAASLKPANSSSSASAGDKEFFLSGSLTVEDVRAAHRLATTGYWPRIILSAMFVVTFSLVILAMAVTSRPYSPEASNRMMLVVCVLFPVLIAIPLVRSRLILHSMARKKLDVFSPTQTTISKSGLKISDEHSTTEINWSAFKSWRANHTVAILFFTSSGYLLIARQKLDNRDEWEGLIGLIRGHVPASEAAMQNAEQTSV